MLRYILPFLLLWGTLITGCSNEKDRIAVLWAARPEIASYVEVFNSEQESYRIELEYRKHPAQSLLTENTPPDIIISDYLINSKTEAKLEDLSPLLNEEEGEIKREWFYAQLLAHGQGGEQQLVLPISFNLPAMIFRTSELEGKVNPFLLTLEEIRELNREFILQQNGEIDEKTPLTHIGYSPRWEPSFLYSLAVILGTNFRETSSGLSAWNQSNLENTIRYARNWISGDNGGYHRCRNFSDKYLYSPGYKLVNSGRVLFSHTDARTFFTVPKEHQESFSIRWFGDEGKIRIMEDILSFGVPRESKNKKAAYAFAKWFFNPEKQAELLNTTKFKRIRTFGIGQGFSTLKEVSRREFPLHYPLLAGHIPPEEYLQLGNYMPLRWEDIKKEVIIPWLIEAVAENGSKVPLEARLRTWYLQKPLE
jgi:ABC-type glycerol-3-phosphate transport system substrate-binding protein